MGSTARPRYIGLREISERDILELYCNFLKGYCTVFQHTLKSLEITVSVLSKRMSKTARKNTKGLKSYKEFKF